MSNVVKCKDSRLGGVDSTAISIFVDLLVVKSTNTSTNIELAVLPTPPGRLSLQIFSQFQFLMFCTLLGVVLIEVSEGKLNSESTAFVFDFIFNIFSLLHPSHLLSPQVDKAFHYSRTMSFDLDSLALFPGYLTNLEWYFAQALF